MPSQPPGGQVPREQAGAVRKGQAAASAGEGKRGFVRAMSLFPSTALNMSQMVGIGPFITIPLILAVLTGPLAIAGWVVGALIAMCDGLVWAELGAAMPTAGGSYVYLREGFQYYMGRFMPFMFVWSTLLVTPLIMSTGMIGMTDYLGYFWHMSPWVSHLVAVGLTVLTVALLWRRIESVATITKLLWAGMIVTVGLVIVGTFSHFNAHQAFHLPPGTFSLGSFAVGLGAALVISIYDYLGYYTVAYIGDEVKRPGRVIPKAIILSILAVMCIDLAMNIGILGVLPRKAAISSKFIGTDALNAVWGRPGAVAVTILILWTAFASVYTGLLGASRLPFNAAKDRMFFRPFGKLHKTLRFPHVSLLVMAAVTAAASFFTLTAIINALIALVIWVQFIGQIVALTILRKKQPQLKRPYRQWLYPVPSIIAVIGWIYIFQGAGWSAIRLTLIWTGLGVVAFLIWAKIEHTWPFGEKLIREEFLEEQGGGELPGETRKLPSAAHPFASRPG
jgi:amino acid transporter